MSLIGATRNRALVPGVIIVSPPKAGTHLALKALSLLPGLKVAAHARPLRDVAETEAADPRSTPFRIGIDWPLAVSARMLALHLDAVGRGRYTSLHLPHSEATAGLLRARGLRTLLILRDPRDVVASHAEYVARETTHFLFETYQQLTPEERRMRSIWGLPPVAPGQPGLLDVGARFRSALGWARESGVLTLRFEDLVGPRGGGSREAQERDLGRLASAIGATCDGATRSRIADCLFGGTATFRRGAIGSWRDVFSREVIEAFKDHTGDLLIELGYEKDDAW